MVILEFARVHVGAALWQRVQPVSMALVKDDLTRFAVEFARVVSWLYATPPSTTPREGGCSIGATTNHYWGRTQQRLSPPEPPPSSPNSIFSLCLLLIS